MPKPPVLIPNPETGVGQQHWQITVDGQAYPMREDGRATAPVKSRGIRNATLDMLIGLGADFVYVCDDHDFHSAWHPIYDRAEEPQELEFPARRKEQGRGVGEVWVGRYRDLPSGYFPVVNSTFYRFSAADLGPE